MKILAIRGKNLASLAGTFAVELDQAPLDRAGLFAITGPTGAGKTTLLDALCLALFDCTPRLCRTQRSAPAIGRAGDDPKDRLSSHDVRSLLRRGAALAEAEVDFLGADGRRYRAHWEVQRARGRSEGRIQQQTLELRDLQTGQALGRTKGEVLAEIEKRLGLSFEQFRRSALLAQGDFAAFLVASAEVRAELLERMTGTDIYGQLSMAAHERCRDELQACAKLEAGIAAVAVLGAEARTQLEQATEKHAARVSALRDQLRQLEKASEWDARLAVLRGEEREARFIFEGSLRRFGAGAGLREEVARVTLLEPLRPLLTAVADRTAERDRAAQAREQRRGALDGTAVAIQHGQAFFAAAERSQEGVIDAWRCAQPEWERVRALDSDLRTASSRLADAEQSEAEVRRGVEAASVDEDEAKATDARLGREREEAQRWLRSNEGLAILRQQWPRCEAALRQALDVHRRLAPLERERGRLEVELQERGFATEREAAASEQARIRAEKARDLLEKARAAALPESSGRLRQAREAWTARRERLSQLELLLAAADTERLEQLRLEGGVAESRRRREVIAKEAAEAAVAVQVALGALDEARRALDQARATRDLASHRAALIPLQPCPLCGATEHPYAFEAPLTELIDSLAARVAKVEEGRLASERARATALAGLAAAERERDAFAVRLEGHSQRLTAFALRWTQALIEFERSLPGIPGALDDALRDAYTQGQLVEQSAAARLELAALAEAERAEEGRRADLQQAQLEFDQSQQAQAATELRRKEGEGATVLLEQRSQQTDQVLVRLREERDRLHLELDGPLGCVPGWQERLAATPEAFFAHCQQQVDAVASHQRSLDAVLAAAGLLQPRLAELQATRVERAARKGALAMATAQRRAELSRLTQQRRELLGGQPLAEVQAAMTAIVEAAAVEVAQRRVELEAARALEAQASEELAGAEGVLAERALDVGEAVAVRDEALLRQGVTLDVASLLLARDARWAAQAREELAALSHSVAQASAVVEERAACRSKAELEGVGYAPTEERTERLGPVAAEVAEAERALAAARAVLEADQASRRQIASQQLLIDSQRARSEVWQALQELIGSADGKKFRVFAQSLTLESLLVHANLHLAELAPRYALMRVPDHDLDLQIIDRDMADEVRSVTSLSGGESFLVSLALALGLSSLSSRQTRVETLFIDEGFGSLDPEALDSALGMLESLQATGRQVGLISHVAGLAERIGTQVQVVRRGSGRSEVVVAGASLASLEREGSRASASA